MFSKTADKTADQTAAPPIPQRQPGSNAGKSLLGSDLKITGEIISSGTVEVLGEVDGNIAADTLTVGNDGRISGSVRATTIEVKGRLEGKVDSQTFTMRATSQVAADISYAALIIESGASIEGRFTKPKA